MHRARHEEAVSFGKGSRAGKMRRQQEKRNPNTSWIGSIKEAEGLSLQELSRAVEDKTVWMSLVHRVARNQHQVNGM